MMSKTSKPVNQNTGEAARSEQPPRALSSFRLIVVASQRNKQLVRGALRRIEPNPRRTRNTSVAIEEVRRGLVTFTT
jgi:DNA-directed RNA polymerase omega subunit